MSTQDIIDNALPMTEDLKQLIAINNSLLDAIIDIKQLLQNDRQINYPGTLPTEPKIKIYTPHLNIAHLIGRLQCSLTWTSDPEEHLKFEGSSKTLKVLWPSTTDDGYAHPFPDEVSRTYSILMYPMYAGRRLNYTAGKYILVTGGNDSEINFEDHFLSLAQHKRKFFKHYASLPVPDNLYSSPEVEKIWDLIRVKQRGSSAVSAQIQAALSYSPAVTEDLKEYPKYGKRLLELADFINGQPPTLLTLFTDRSDVHQFYKIWLSFYSNGLIVIGTLFALCSLALSAVQIWVALKALWVAQDQVR